MDIPSYDNMKNLFAQLGLPNDTKNIQDFIDNHYISDNIRVEQAPFWSASQAAFLANSMQQETNWAKTVNHLSTELRH